MNQKNERGSVITIVSTSVIALVLGYTFYYRPLAEKQAADDLVAKKVQADRIAEDNLEKGRIKYLTDSVRGTLKDPDAALFKDVRLFSLKNRHKDGVVSTITFTLCGEVNAKNELGGYVGYKRFLAQKSFDEDLPWVRILKSDLPENFQKEIAELADQICRDVTKEVV